MIRASNIFALAVFALTMGLANFAAAEEFTNPYADYSSEQALQVMKDNHLGSNGANISGGAGGVSGAISGVTNGVSTTIGNVTGGAKDAIGGVTGAVGGVVGGVTGGINNAIGGVTGAVGGVVGGITGGINNAIGGVTGAVGGVVSGITGGINGAIGGITGGIGGSKAEPTATGKTFAHIDNLSTVCKFTVKRGETLNVISKSVSCFETMFLGIVNEKLVGMTDFMREAVFAAMVLYIIFYGIKTSTGLITEQRARGEFFIHALKIAFVSWLVMSYGIMELWALTLDIYNGLLDLVLVPAAMDSCPINSKSVNDLWLSMDCILTEFIGWNTQNGYGKTVKELPLLFGMFTSAFKSGAGGALIATLVFLSIMSLTVAMMRVAFVYILSMMGLILAFMVAPIIIPFMLFPQTKPMFDGWWKLIVAMILQPVILFAYLSFMLAIFVEIIDGENGLKEIYGVVKPQMQTTGVENRGTETSITSMFTMFDDSPDKGALKMEPQLVFNLLSIFIVSYLMSSFTNFVGQMGKELSGSPLSPDLSAMTPKFLSGGM